MDLARGIDKGRFDSAGSGANDSQRELEALYSKLARNRAEETGAIRRSAEEAERSMVRRIEETERRALRCQAEESSAVQSFLTSWHSGTEARFERQASQIASFVDRRISEEMERARGEMQRSNDTSMDALRSSLQTLETEISSVAQAEVQAAMESTLLTAQRRAADTVEALRRDLTADVVRRDSEARDAIVAINERLAGAEALTEACVSDFGDVAKLARSASTRVATLEDDLAPAVAGLRVELVDANDHQRESLLGEMREMHETSKAFCSEISEQQTIQAQRLEDTSTCLRDLHNATVAASSVAEAAKRDCAERFGDAETKAALAREDVHKASQFARASSQKAEAAGDAVARLEAELSRAQARLEELVRQEIGRASAVVQNQISVTCGGVSEGLSDQRSKVELLRSKLELIEHRGPTYEWRIRKCMTRLEYLSISNEAGIWLDSEVFALGHLSPVQLRLYPAGIRNGDGQCAVGLWMPKEAAAQHLSSNLTRLSLVIGSIRKCVAPRRDEDGGALWLMSGLGTLAEHLTIEAAENGACSPREDRRDGDLRLQAELSALQVEAVHSEKNAWDEKPRTLWGEQSACDEQSTGLWGPSFGNSQERLTANTSQVNARAAAVAGASQAQRRDFRSRLPDSAGMVASALPLQGMAAANTPELLSSNGAQPDNGGNVPNEVFPLEARTSGTASSPNLRRLMSTSSSLRQGMDASQSRRSLGTPMETLSGSGNNVPRGTGSVPWLGTFDISGTNPFDEAFDAGTAIAAADGARAAELGASLCSSQSVPRVQASAEPPGVCPY